MSQTTEILYKKIEEDTIKEITFLDSLVSKRKKATSKTKARYYDKKIFKVRNKCLKQIHKLYRIDPEKTTTLINDVFNEGGSQ